MFFPPAILIELLAEEIQDPFGSDLNDLPIESFIETIEDNLIEISETS